MSVVLSLHLQSFVMVAPRNLLQLLNSPLPRSEPSLPLGAAPCAYTVCPSHGVHAEHKPRFWVLALWRVRAEDAM